jgi:predicted nucleic acid-binding Zn ribbon protein
VREPARKIGDLLRSFLAERGWLEPGPYAALFRDWASVAGPGLADHSRLVDVRDGVLMIDVDHPGWLQMAHFRKAALVAAAKNAAGSAPVVDARFSVGSAPAAPR